MHPAQMMFGLLTVASLFGGYNYLQRNQGVIAELQQKHPLLSLAGVLVCGYTVVSLMGSVMVLMFGILLPISGKL